MKNLYLLLFIIFTICSAETCSTKKSDPIPVVPEPLKSSAKNIISFTFDTFNPKILGTIDTLNNTINVALPFKTDLSNLVPTISISEKASLSPSSGTSQNFSTPVIYTVMAENQSKRSFTVSVSTLKPSKSDLEKIASNWKSISPLRHQALGIDKNETFWGFTQESNSFPKGFIVKYEKGKEVILNQSGSKIPLTQVNGIFEFNNKIWIASSDGIFSIFGSDTIAYNKTNSAFDFDNIKSLKTINNNLYCSTKNSIFILEANNWKKILSISDDEIIDFAVFKNEIYFISSENLYKYDQSTIKYPKKIGNTSFDKINIDSNGRLWISNWWSIIKFENEKFTEFSRNTIKDFPGAGLMTFIIDNNNLLWLAWGKHGVLVFDESKILHNFTLDNSNIVSDNINTIFYRNNTIYTGCFKYTENANLKNAISFLKLQ